MFNIVMCWPGQAERKIAENSCENIVVDKKVEKPGKKLTSDSDSDSAPSLVMLLNGEHE